MSKLFKNWEFEFEVDDEWGFAFVLASGLLGICIWKWGFSIQRKKSYG